MWGGGPSKVMEDGGGRYGGRCGPVWMEDGGCGARWMEDGDVCGPVWTWNAEPVWARGVDDG